MLQVKNVLESTIGTSPLPEEYKEYLLCKMYQCTPSRLAEEDIHTTEMHFQFMMTENEARALKQERDQWENKSR